MTVRELMAFLSDCDGDMHVCMEDQIGDGYNDVKRTQVMELALGTGKDKWSWGDNMEPISSEDPPPEEYKREQCVVLDTWGGVA